MIRTAAEHPAAGRRGAIGDRSLRRSPHEGSGAKTWPRPTEPDRDPGCAAGARHDRTDHAGPYRRSGADGGGGRQDGAFRDQVGAGPAGAVRQCQPDPEQGGGVEEHRAVRVVLRPRPAGQTGGIPPHRQHPKRRHNEAGQANAGGPCCPQRHCWRSPKPSLPQRGEHPGREERRVRRDADRQPGPGAGRQSGQRADPVAFRRVQCAG